MVDLVPFVVLPAGQLLAVLWLLVRRLTVRLLAALQFAALRAAVRRFAAPAPAFAHPVAKNAHSIKLIIISILLVMSISFALAIFADIFLSLGRN
ncbi:MAG: hypothetical protein K6G34_15450 [Lachnospiraceae bacterium]|nr:hypothetical protein [Lachnospiraceae bacterium]